MNVCRLVFAIQTKVLAEKAVTEAAALLQVRSLSCVPPSGHPSQTNCRKLSVSTGPTGFSMLQGPPQVR